MFNNLIETDPLFVSKIPSSDKVSEDNYFLEKEHKLDPCNAITYVYKINVAKKPCNVSTTWCKSATSHSLTITFDKPSKDNRYTCKIDLKSSQFWGKKGLKSFDIDGTRLDLFWDFREVRFSETPDPSSCFYVALVRDGEIVLLLGDLIDEAYKRTKAKTCSEEAYLLCKKESVCGKRLFCTKVMLNDEGKELDIVIENSLVGPDDPEMWISVEGTVVIRIMNLNWRFRGNETVMINDSPIQIFWDVHDWLFKCLGSSHGLFIFKKGAIESENLDACDARNCGNECEEFCHFLYAWKVQ